MDLTAFESLGFPLGMRQLARQLLRVVMVAVAISVSSLSGYATTLAAFDVHEHGSHGLHGHGLHDHAADQGHDHGDASDVADTAHDQNDDPAANGKLCTGMHVHCCCPYAVPAADISLKLAHEHASVAAAVSHIPHGQLAAPLFRPPRAIA